MPAAQLPPAALRGHYFNYFPRLIAFALGYVQQGLE
jgi:hypothetical protein